MVIYFSKNYKYYANGTVVYFNPVTGKKCTAKENKNISKNKNNCLKWYTFGDKSIMNNKINLLLDHNTTKVIAWNSKSNNIIGPDVILKQLLFDTKSWKGVPFRNDKYILNNGIASYTINYSSYRARLISADEVAYITGNTNFSSSKTIYTKWFYFDSSNQNQIASSKTLSKYHWLFDYTNNCINYGCKVTDNSNNGYWTSTAVYDDPGGTWGVDNYGTLSNNYVVSKNIFGIRPVITIAKSKL